MKKIKLSSVSSPFVVGAANPKGSCPSHFLFPRVFACRFRVAGEVVVAVAFRFACVAWKDKIKNKIYLFAAAFPFYVAFLLFYRA